MNAAVYFEIPVTDMPRAIAFYQAVFGYAFELDTIHDCEMAFFPLDEQQGGISGALAKGSIYKPSHEGSLIYLQTDDLEATLQRATDLGAPILFPLTDNPGWGYVAEIEDSEGNRIALKQAEK